MSDIGNVTGRGLETTAAKAQAEAPTSSIARREVKANADNAKDVAHDAASTAQSKGTSLTGDTPSALDQLQQQASKTLNSAVDQGKHDVGAAKSTVSGDYVDKARDMASSAISTAQSYLPESVGGHANGANGTYGNDVVSSLQSGATSALETTKEYLSVAQEAVKPHIENAKSAAQGYLGTAATEGIDTHGNPPVPQKDIPATSAPLESAAHSFRTPYPSTTTTSGTNVEQEKA